MRTASFTFGILLLGVNLAACRSRRRRDHVAQAEKSGELDGSAGWSRKKRDEVASATAAEQTARDVRTRHGLPPLPLFPTHTATCGERRCRPGEGSMKGYTMWSQPYEHRQYYVESRSRRAPHGADPATTYAGLVAVAKRASVGGLVLLAASEFDYRLLILNWVRKPRGRKLSVRLNQ